MRHRRGAVCDHACVKEVLVALFWLWLLVALGVYAYRIFRRVTQGPKAQREAAAAAATADAGATASSRLAGFTPPPLPDGPVEARLPRSLQGAGAPSPAGDPAPATDHTPVEAPEPDGAGRAGTVAEAVEGIRMPAALLPVVEPDDPKAAAGRTARFSGTGTSVTQVTHELAEELERLGFAVDGLDTLTSSRAGLSAWRGATTVAARVELDPDTAAVVVELSV